MKRILIVLLCVPLTAYAEPDQNKIDQLLRTLKENGTITQEQYSDLYSQPTGNVKVSTKGGLKVQSEDGLYSFKLGGRVRIDGAMYDGGTELNSGTEIRDARLEVKGTIGTDYGYKASWNFADNEVDAKSIYGYYTGFGPTVKVGFFGIPTGMIGATSSKYTTFMEKPLPIDAFELDSHIAVGLDHGGLNWSVQTAIYGEDASVNDAGDEGGGIAGRFTYAPIVQDSKVLHTGLTLGYQTPTSEVGGLKTHQLRARPEAHVNAGRLVDTGSILNVDDIYTYGLETAFVNGSVSGQAEYLVTNVNGIEDYQFDGYYAQISWFPTGESRPYIGSEGAFGRVKPKSKDGAWELAGRYSHVDLTDGSTVGGTETNYTLGANYYMLTNLRFMTNYILVDGVGDDPTILQMRMQYDF